MGNLVGYDYVKQEHKNYIPDYVQVKKLSRSKKDQGGVRKRTPKRMDDKGTCFTSGMGKGGRPMN